MRYLTPFFLFLVLPACGGDSKVPDAGDTIIEGEVDADGDGATAGADCDDDDPMVHPGAAELCNERDDDCDGLVDEDGMDGTVFYRDADGDGFGDATIEQMSCSAPAHFVSDSTDCDDGRADVYPDAAEDDCTDPVDYNCDGSVGYADLDGDGTPACTDCDDTNPAINPFAAEICNDGIDDNCDGEADETGAVGEQMWFADADGDLHGDPAVSMVACDQPDGYVDNPTDCDDASAAASPSGVEICDGLDNDCDGLIDGPDPVGGMTVYPDSDGDGHGSAGSPVEVCTPMAGFVESSDDCDDADAGAYPSAEEICDGVDNDCSGGVDEGLGSTYYADPDGDGYGTSLMTIEACDVPDGYATMDGDCDETDGTVYPGATEVCDGIDNDCSGGVDEGLMSVYYADPDGDGYGMGRVTIEACDVPDGYATMDGDCDEWHASVHPGALEVCDGKDNNCSEGVDEGLMSVYYADPDGDGYGMSLMTIEACDAPDGYATIDGDCDETDDTVYPGAAEVCDGVDNDCSGGVDEDLGSIYYADPDGDGYGMGLVTMEACDVPDGYSAMDGDCDETDGSVYPGAAEVCDGIDNDCSGGVDEDLESTFFLDTDGDGYGESSETIEACDMPVGYALVDGDCDLTDSSINPGAAEVCDGTDNDCDTLVDDDDPTVEVPLGSSWYADADGDGHGVDADSVLACEAPAGFVGAAGDCDDADETSYPGATEIWYDGIDQDCAGDGDSDADGDGHDAVVTGGDDTDDTDPDCWDACVMEGLTADAPADSCQAIADDHPSAPNDWYWIDPEGSPMEVFCDIDNGGWMRCFELVNTPSEDLGTENTWLNDCIDFSNASWTSNEVRVTLEDGSGSEIYDEWGTRDHAWTYDHITSTTSASNQYDSAHHGRLVSLSNGDKLMMAGQSASNSGCGGSFGAGYSVVVYPSSPDYYSNVKMLVVPYMQPISGGTRGFSGWSTAHEISYQESTMNTCSSTISQLGTFSFWLR
jgi:large repetitive protein